MIKIEFTEEAREELHTERYEHEHPRVREKMEALYLRSMGVPTAEICRLCQITRSALAKHLKDYRDGGIERLKEWKCRGGRAGGLSPHKEIIEAEFRQKPPHSIGEAVVRIEALTGVARNRTSVRLFMKKIGMKLRKVGAVPKGADTPAKQEEQEDFCKKKLYPMLQEAREGIRVVLFIDAAHFVQGAFLSSIWCFCRMLIASSSGRKRWNVLGALDAVSLKVHTVCNSTYINAQSVCEMLSNLRSFYGEKPITVFLDNARYQRCDAVSDCAKALQIELEFLPSYSPNLNLIERFWKFVKKKSLNDRYHGDFTSFCEAINGCIASSDTVYKNELKSLLTHKFQSFKKLFFC
jgi:transposase